MKRRNALTWDDAEKQQIKCARQESSSCRARRGLVSRALAHVNRRFQRYRDTATAESITFPLVYSHTREFRILLSRCRAQTFLRIRPQLKLYFRARHVMARVLSRATRALFRDIISPAQPRATAGFLVSRARTPPWLDVLTAGGQERVESRKYPTRAAGFSNIGRRRRPSALILTFRSCTLATPLGYLAQKGDVRDPSPLSCAPWMAIGKNFRIFPRYFQVSGSSRSALFWQSAILDDQSAEFLYQSAIH